VKRERTAGNQRTARVIAGLAVLTASVLAASPHTPASETAGPAHAGHGHGRTVPLHRLEAVTRSRWPNSFAGLWQARGKVFVAFTAKAKRRTGRLRELVAKPGKIRAVNFERSLRELENLEEQIISDRENRPPGTVGLPGYDVDLNVTKNAATLTFANVNPGQEMALRDLYGQDLIVKEGPLAEFDACLSRVSCTPTLRAGLQVLFRNPDAALVPCSTSFAVQQRTAVYRGILSAAHCGDPDFDEGGLRYHGTGLAPPSYGVVDRDRLQGRNDAEVHEITSSSFSRQALIYRSSVQKALPVQRVSEWNWVRPGMGMCKVGRTTGHTCGKVKSRYFSPDIIPSAERFVLTTYCAEGGDSGGGVYAPNKLASGEVKVTAYGIHSGGAKDFECNEDGSIKPGDYSYFGHLQYAQTALGVRVQVTK